MRERERVGTREGQRERERVRKCVRERHNLNECKSGWLCMGWCVYGWAYVCTQTLAHVLLVCVGEGGVRGSDGERERVSAFVEIVTFHCIRTCLYS